jgi:rubrerythrin
VIELRSVKESLERKVKSLKEKHTGEIRQLEDELSEIARQNEENRVRGQSAANEVVEKKVASTISNFNDKMKVGTLPTCLPALILFVWTRWCGNI